MVTAGRGKGVVVPPPLRVQLPWRRLSWHITSARGLGSHHLCRSRRLDSYAVGTNGVTHVRPACGVNVGAGIARLG